MTNWIRECAPYFQHIPVFLQRMPYSTALYWLRFLAKRKIPFQPTLWARNSYQLGTLVMGVSDLDLALYFAHRPNSVALKAWQKLESRTKKWAPFLGECTLYVEDDVLKLLNIVNIFELKRDPVLKKKVATTLPLKLPCDEFLQAQARVFLLRMLESDYHNLLVRPFLRLKKWQFHLTEVAQTLGKGPVVIGPDQIRPEALMDVIHSLVWNKDQEIVVKEVACEYLSKRGLPLHEDSLTLKKEFIMCFLHRWLGYSLHRKTFSQELDLIGRLNTIEAYTVLAQLDWELWGLSHQRPWIKDQEGLNRHVSHLWDIFQVIVQNHDLSNSFVKHRELAFSVFKDSSPGIWDQS